MTQKRPNSKLPQRIWQSVRKASNLKTNASTTANMQPTSSTSSTVRLLPYTETSCLPSSPTSLSFFSLPPELYLMLFNLLDYESLLKLGATSKHFRSMIRREHIVAALYRDESTIHNLANIRNERLACFQCYKLRSAFFDFDNRGIHPKFTVTGTEAGRRRCLICLMPNFPTVEKVVETRGGKCCTATPNDRQPSKQQALSRN
jgi:F-box domain